MSVATITRGKSGALIANEDLVRVAVRAFVQGGAPFTWGDIEAAPNLMAEGHNAHLPAVAEYMARDLGCKLRSQGGGPAVFQPPTERLDWKATYGDRKRDSSRRSARRRRERFRKLGLCSRCGKVPPPKGFKICEPCRERQRKYHRKWKANALQGPGEATPV